MTERVTDEVGGLGAGLGAGACLRTRWGFWRRSSRGGPRVFRACEVVFQAAVWLIVSIAVAGGALFFALSRGPIALDWLAPTIIQSLDELYGKRFDFSLRAATLANAEHGPTLAVEGLTVRSDGKIILAAPRAALSIDFRSLFLGRLRPRHLEAFNLELRLAVQPNGGVSIFAGADANDAVSVAPPAPDVSAEPEAEAGPAPVRAAILHQAAEALRGFIDLATSPDSAIGVVDQLGITHGRLIIDDRTVDRIISYDDLSLSLNKDRGGMAFSLAATGASRRWSLTALAKGAPGGRRIVDMSLRDISIDEIALASGVRNLKFDTDAPLSLDFRVALTDDNRIAEASGGVKVGAGFFRLDEPDHEPVLINSISGAVRWDRAGRQFLLGPLDFKAAGYDLAVEGVATPVRHRDAAPGDAKSDDSVIAPVRDAWNVTAHLTRPAFAAPDRAGGTPVRVDRLDLRARVSPNEKKVTLDKVDITGPEVNFGYTGAFDVQHGPHLVYEMTITDSHIPAITRLWPTHVGGGVRAWFVDHVTGGTIRRLAVSADFDEAAFLGMRYEQPPPDNSARGEAEVVNATLSDILPGMAPITGVSGQLRTTGRSAFFAATSGAMETGRERHLNVSEGSFLVADTALHPAPANLDLKLSGDVEAVADILAVPAIAPFATLPVEASALKGGIDGRLQLDFDLGPTARSDHTIAAIEANTSGLSIDHFMGAERLEGGALNIVSDRTGLRVTGTGRLYGAPATLDLQRPRGDKAAAQANISLLFDDAARAKAGFPLPGVTGPMAVTMKTQGVQLDANAQVDIDLAKTTLDSPLPGMTKPAGKPGKASFVLTHRPDGLTLDQFSLDSVGAKLSGVIELAKDGGFRGAKLTQMRLSPGDDARADIQRVADVMKISVRGANIDARPMLHSLTQPARERVATASGGKRGMSFDDFDLDLKSPIVTGHGKQILANVDLKMERRSGRLRALELNGKFGHEPLAAAMVRNQGGAPQIEVSSGDGGSMLSFLDFYQKMDSGALTASIQLSQDRADGVLRIRDFYLKGEPAMRQLVSQGASRTDARGASRFDPDSVRVARLQSGFGWTTGRLSLRDGVMSGPEMGLTFDGYIDFAHERVDVGGSYVPAYDINNLISNIPVVGILLAGGQHEGVFALNYRVTGDLGEPIISVNPLSALAPGLIRKMMGIMDGTARPQDGGVR